MHLQDRSSIRLYRSHALTGVDCVQAKFFNHVFPLHAHTGFCLGVILEGAEEFRHGRRHEVARNGDVLLINPDEEHTGSPVDRSWSHIAIFVEPSAPLQWWPEIYSNEVPTFKTPTAWDPVAGARIQALARAVRGHEDALTVQTSFVELGWTLARHNAFGHKIMSCDSPVRRVRALLDDAPTDNLDLRVLAGEAGLAPIQLLRAFRASVGCTPHVYRTARRLRLARRSIEAGEPLAQAAVTAGFYDQSHLSRTLRQWTGLTPRQLASSVEWSYPASSKPVHDEEAPNRLKTNTFD